jgi:hypothetical protein
MKYRFLLTTFYLTLIYSGNGNSAVENVLTGKITAIENGWFGEGIVLKHTNGKAGCGSDQNEFAISKDHAGYKEIAAIALTAFTSQADVQLIVDTGVCLFGNRTKVLAVRLVKT